MRRFTKRRNCSTLRAAQDDNLSFKRRSMTRRSMPRLFHANLFVLDGARCQSSTRDVTVAGVVMGEGGTWGRSFSAGSWGHSLRQRCIECSGKYEPVFGRIAGHGFRMGWVVENATRNIAPKRDAVSPTCPKRKAHPIPELQNGMRFPCGRIVAATLSASPATRPESAPRARPGCPPRSRRRRLPALRGRGSPS